MEEDEEEEEDGTGSVEAGSSSHMSEGKRKTTEQVSKKALSRKKKMVHKNIILALGLLTVSYFNYFSLGFSGLYAVILDYQHQASLDSISPSSWRYCELAKLGFSNKSFISLFSLRWFGSLTLSN